MPDSNESFRPVNALAVRLLLCALFGPRGHAQPYLAGRSWIRLDGNEHIRPPAFAALAVHETASAHASPLTYARLRPTLNGSLLGNGVTVARVALDHLV